MSASVRLRLTGWYALALGLMLVAYAGVTFFAVRHEFRERLHEELAEERTAATAAGGIETDAQRTARLEARLRQQLGEIGVVLVLGLPLVVLMAGAGGYVLARRALTPIDRLASETRRITAERLYERLSIANPHDEIGRLALAINETFARLESSFAGLRRFTADASHEFRTPLAVMRGIGEVGLSEPRSVGEYRRVIGDMLEEVDRLSTLVDTLLRLSHADAGTIRLSREEVEVQPLLTDLTASLGVLAEERDQRVTVDASDGLVVTVDRVLLREALMNIVDNAIKYSPHGSTISLHASRMDGEVVVTVADQGPGIPREQRDRIFDRFFRIDEGRSRAAGGSGLGLAIAKWAVEVNGGRITAEENPSGGSLFRLILPIAFTILGCLSIPAAFRP